MGKDIITEDNYFDSEFQEQYMSVSQFKSFMKCPAQTMAQLRGEFETGSKDAFLEGHFVEESLFGDIEDFKSKHIELYAYKKVENGLKANFKKLENVINTALGDELFMSYLDGEHQVVRTGEIAGVPFKIMMDIYHKDRIVDLKAMANIKNGYFIDDYRYDIQGAVYQAIEGNNKPFYIAALSKEAVPDKIIIQIDQEILDNCLETVKYYAPKFQAIKDGILLPDRCEECDYCKSTKKLTNVVKLKELYEREKGEY